MNDDLIPLFGIIFLFGAPVAAWIVSRVLAHQERIEMIRRGVMPPPSGRWSRRDMRYGAWQEPGMPPPGASNIPPPPGFGIPDMRCYPQAQLRKGISVALIGFALLIGLSFIDLGHPGPWLLGGLIPLFVGIAQIINAVLNGAVIPMFGPRTDNGTFAPPPQQQQQQQYGGAGGWRPGPAPEIPERPVHPPDVR